LTSFTATKKSVDEIPADAAALFMFAGQTAPTGIASRRLRSDLAGLIAEEKFEGKSGQTVTWYTNGQYPSRRYIVVGLGKKEKFGPGPLRDAVATAARRAEAVRAERLVLEVPGDGASHMSAKDRIAAVVEGVLLGTYKFDRYLNDDAKKSHPPEAATLSTSLPAGEVKEGIRLGGIVSEATILARELVTEPAGVITPSEMARRASKVAQQKGLQIKVLEKKDLEKLGMGAFLGVNRGSEEPPKLIHLVYKPRGARPTKRIALIGKGITFDSGGLNLKGTGFIETMKCDMSGSAAVLAAMSTLRELEPRVEVHGFMAMTENMIDAAAYKPGDVLKTMKGKTVEVTNTDAEGRLVLIDALAYAQTFKPDAMIDLATLTGACVVALGPFAAGVMSNNQRLSDAICQAAGEVGEKMWPLPLYEEYLEMLSSEVADLKNSGERWGGALTGGLFLQEFVDEKIPWAHLDIAGPAFLDRETPLARKGGTGAGVRTVVRYLQSL
jgi:leucyl aminopeptidase